MFTEEIKKRFWDKVNKTETCWNWIAGLRTGYGVFKINKKSYGAHRVSWELANGKIENGLFVCHKCDNPKCVNPSHLFLGTHSDNMKDAYSKGRLNTMFISGETRFKFGRKPTLTPVDANLGLKIKELVNNRGSIKLTNISRFFRVKNQFVRDISAGRILKNIENRVDLSL